MMIKRLITILLKKKKFVIGSMILLVCDLSALS